MKLFITRHGETEWNAIHRYQGQSDIPLNQMGIKQAQQIAKRLSGKKIDAICTSDLSRTVDTAQIIAEHHKIEVLRDSRWRELSFGDWEGLNYDEINGKYHDQVTKWYADPVNSSPPNGETVLQLAERVQSVLDDLKNKYKDEETVLLVSHSGAIQALLCLTLGVDLSRYWQFRVLQASLTIISFYEDGVILNLFNDISHLQEK